MQQGFDFSLFGRGPAPAAAAVAAAPPVPFAPPEQQVPMPRLRALVPPPPPLDDSPVDEPPKTLAVIAEGLDRKIYFNRILGAKLGMSFVRRGAQQTLEIIAISAQAPVARWNQSATDATVVHVGDHIVSVNGHRNMTVMESLLRTGSFLKIEVVRGFKNANVENSGVFGAFKSFDARDIGVDVAARPLRNGLLGNNVGVGCVQDPQRDQEHSIRLQYPNAAVRVASQDECNAVGDGHLDAGGAALGRGLAS